MTKFEALFGIKSSQVKKNCVLMPILPKGILDAFGIQNVTQGKLYRCGLARDFTLIVTGVGPAFVGDAVLYLSKTLCRNIILFGSCGLTKEKKGLSVGSLVTPVLCHEGGLFSGMLTDAPKKTNLFFPNNELIETFLFTGVSRGVHPVKCCSVSSLKLEEENLGWFANKDIDVLDMECAACFAAASYAGIRAMGLFYITDIVKSRPFYTQLEPALQQQLPLLIRNAAGIICEFIKKRLRD